MLIMACATTLSLMFLRINYYYVLGPIAGVAILLPYVGVFLSTIPAVAVAYIQFDGEKAILVLLVYSLLQFLEGNVLTPLIVGNKVRLFPLTVMIAFIFWGTIWGVAGAVLAVPLTSAIKVVCEHVRGWEGLAPVPGWNGRYEWTGWRTADALRRGSEDGAAGYVVSANNNRPRLERLEEHSLDPQGRGLHLER
jgi:predicted PurR-regulated permease PerM